MYELDRVISDLQDAQGAISQHVSKDFCSIPTNTLVMLKEMHSKLQDVVDDLRGVNRELREDEE